MFTIVCVHVCACGNIWHYVVPLLCIHPQKELEVIGDERVEKTRLWPHGMREPHSSGKIGNVVGDRRTLAHEMVLYVATEPAVFILPTALRIFDDVPRSNNKLEHAV